MLVYGGEAWVSTARPARASVAHNQRVDCNNPHYTDSPLVLQGARLTPKTMIA